jgi:ornithine decarboxylase
MMNVRLSQVIGQPVFDIKTNASDFMKSKILNRDVDAAFATLDLTSIIKQYQKWTDHLPMVKPHYAVKCNPDPCVLRLLSAMGANFDCATQGEIDLVLHGLGDFCVSPDQIVYANPAKMDKHLEFAMSHRIGLTVIDGEDELYKLAEMGAQEKLSVLIRLTTDDKDSVCRFSKKFGCPVADAPNLLRVAKSLGINVRGVSFHVGSGCGDPQAYVTALEDARAVFDAAEKLEMPKCKVVDIGGGFPGSDEFSAFRGLPTFDKIAVSIKEGIKKHFSDLHNVEFVAEPGRYMIAAAGHLATKVYARKGGKTDCQALYIDDGVYGSFNHLIYDHAVVQPKLFKEKEDSEKVIPTQIFGPTCDGMD